MKEEIQMVIKFELEKMRLKSIEDECIKNNVSQIRIIEKEGFKREGMLR